MQWHKLKAKLVAEGDFYKLTSFCQNVRPKLNHKQAKRDFISGPNCWRLGSGSRGQGLELVSGKHWVQKSGKRGGIPATYIRKDALESIFYKYFAKK